MKSNAVGILLALVMLTLAMGVSAEGQEKIDVCHQAGTANQAQLSISGAALDSHLKHGDYEGACRDISDKSELCSILDGLDGTFRNGDDIYFTQYFENTNLYHSENVTISVTNNDSTDHLMTGNIRGDSGDYYKSLPFPNIIRLQPGETSSATLTNYIDPAAETNFLVTIRNPITGDGGEPVIHHVIHGSVYFVLSCS